MNFLRCLLKAASATVGLTVASIATAEPEASEQRAARALFEQGKALLDRGAWQGGCAKFDESLALQVNVSTLIKVARCREHQGMLATAGQQYERARALNQEQGGQSREHQAALAAVIERESSELAPRIPRLRIVVADAPEELTIRSNGSLLPATALGETLPVDPSLYEISVEAPGFVEMTKTAKVGERTAPDEVVEVSFHLTPAAKPASAAPPPLRQPPPPTPSKPPAAGSGPSAPVPVPSAPVDEGSDQRRPNSVRSAGYVIGGIGMAGLGAAGVLGILTLERVDASKPYCRYPGGACDDRGMELRDEARQLQTAAFVVAGLSGAAVITGITLVVTAKNRSRTATLSLAPTAIEGQLRW